MSFKRILTTNTLYLSLIIFLLGILLTVLGISGVFYYENPPEFLRGILSSLGDWKYWCILLGPILLIAGGYYLFDNISKRREFKELMDTTSKAKFIKNLDRVEFLAWKLTPEHQRQLSKKKRKFHIK
jgi:hypothetical protein